MRFGLNKKEKSEYMFKIVDLESVEVDFVRKSERERCANDREIN